MIAIYVRIEILKKAKRTDYVCANDNCQISRSKTDNTPIAYSDRPECFHLHLKAAKMSDQIYFTL